ncbi:hypothetical protein QRD43_15635 [Pelomonas sp. APW6]|uniref:PEP-CTERM protein-sorting domain-containing protein n=1 Tax=Roseateles subflavus TaxID=3053353 RepID=A0ABT7LNQ9_9BURK|nr:hypothetical protein [Pelomonas sp. APW6]MDL5033345.1 hypothetical protein [Pelomonas sp. APW6]
MSNYKISTRQWLGAAVLALAAAGAQAGVVYGSNLIVNGDAESDVAASWSAFDGYARPQAVDYGPNWVLPTQPGSADRGKRMFAGDGARTAGYQLLDLAGTLTQPLSFKLSGWLGGWASQGDNALLYVSFLDDGDGEIGHAALGPVTPGDRGNVTGLLYREVSDWLPVGTRRLMFSLSMERLGGGDNDGYADNLAFVLDAPSPSTVPEPAGLSWLALGVMAWASTRRRRAAAP